MGEICRPVPSPFLPFAQFVFQGLLFLGLKLHKEESEESQTLTQMVKAVVLIFQRGTVVASVPVRVTAKSSIGKKVTKGCTTYVS